MWPFKRTEKRSYSDAIVQALTASAEASTGVQATATAALESCAGFVGRAFASAEVSASPMVAPALTPACLAHIGRELLRRGEALFLIRVDDGRLALWPATDWSVFGSPNPTTWTYQVTVSGASTTDTWHDVSADGVVHVMYSFSPWEPWRGVGPLQVARLAGRLSAQLAAALGDEASSPRGAFIGVPLPGDDPVFDTLKPKMRKAKGETLLVEAGDLEAANGATASWKQMRFGADTPAAVVELMKLATMEVYASCGLNPALFTSEGESGAREAYRQALHSVVAPLGRLVAAELSRKLDDAITLDWQELRAGDIAGRARAFQSMVGGGMDVATAAAQAGLMVADE